MVTAHVFSPIRLKKVHSDRIVSITCHSKDRRTGIDDMDSETLGVKNTLNSILILPHLQIIKNYIKTQNC
jgi:hypothetical protein